MRRLLALFVLLAAVAPAHAQYPEAVVSAFCQADGRGARLQGAYAPAVLDGLVAWAAEPAWDRVVLISGYEVQPVRQFEEEVEIEVRYTVVAEVTAAGVREEESLETVRLRLVRSGQGWRLGGPPPAPHLYASGVDARALFAQLMPSSEDYVSNSKLVWRMFQAAGWSVPYQTSADFLAGGYFRAVPEPTSGDVVAYLDRGKPYHVGIYEGEDRVASATATGVLRTSLNAFPGEIRYLRLTAAALPTVTPGAEAEPPADEALPAKDEPLADVEPLPAEDEPLADVEPPAPAAGAAAAIAVVEALVREIDELRRQEDDLGGQLKEALRRVPGRTLSDGTTVHQVEPLPAAAIEDLRDRMEEARRRRRSLQERLAGLVATPVPAAVGGEPSEDIEILEETAPRRPVRAAPAAAEPE